MRLVALAAVAVLAGCATGQDVHWADPQSVRLGWREPPCGGVRIDVHRLTVAKDRWRIAARVENGGRPLTIGRPHTQHGTYFGIVRGDRRTVESLHAAVLARGFVPSLPRRLERGGSWTGSYSGPGRLPAKVPLRLVFGRFTPVGKLTGFLCVSTHAVTL